jgi:MoxR-like ATPase
MNFPQKITLLKQNIEQVIRGKSNVVKMAVTTLLARGHLLIEDVPGVGKTTLAQALARSIHCSFKRVQFTSDLLPSDILGVSIFNPKTNGFEFRPGPIFTQVLLADEINRTTPKTQSSLLEAMNEGQVTVENHTHPLPHPFMVIATQNPSEHQGTYPLPESQLDRFMMRIEIGYPEEADERQILLSQGGQRDQISRLHAVLTVEEILELQEATSKVALDESLIDYLMAIVSATRRSPRLALGVSTRGGLFLQQSARALALVEGRDYCLPDDIKLLAPLVLSHRVIVHSGAETPRPQEGREIIEEILEEIPVPL